MPLILNTPPADLPQRILWDPLETAQIKEAKEKIDALVQKGFTVKQLDEVEGAALLEPKLLNKRQLLMRVMDETGDRRIIWDRNDRRQILEVKKEFEESIARGYKAYVCRMNGSKGRRMDTFDALMEELIISSERDENPRAHGLLVPKALPG